MAKGFYLGDPTTGLARKVKKLYIGDPTTGLVRKVKKVFIGDPVTGLARLFYSSGLVKEIYYQQNTNGNRVRKSLITDSWDINGNDDGLVNGYKVGNYVYYIKLINISGTTTKQVHFFRRAIGTKNEEYLTTYTTRGVYPNDEVITCYNAQTNTIHFMIRDASGDGLDGGGNFYMYHNFINLNTLQFSRPRTNSVNKSSGYYMSIPSYYSVGNFVYYVILIGYVTNNYIFCCLKTDGDYEYQSSSSGNVLNNPVKFNGYFVWGFSPYTSRCITRNTTKEYNGSNIYNDNRTQFYPTPSPTTDSNYSQFIFEGRLYFMYLTSTLLVVVRTDNAETWTTISTFTFPVYTGYSVGGSNKIYFGFDGSSHYVAVRYYKYDGRAYDKCVLLTSSDLINWSVAKEVDSYIYDDCNLSEL